jgi:hypothetical protein
MNIIAATWMDLIYWERLPVGARSLIVYALMHKRIDQRAAICPEHQEAIRTFLIEKYGERSSQVQKVDSVFSELNLPLRTQ